MGAANTGKRHEGEGRGSRGPHGPGIREAVEHACGTDESTRGAHGCAAQESHGPCLENAHNAWFRNICKRRNRPKAEKASSSIRLAHGEELAEVFGAPTGTWFLYDEWSNDSRGSACACRAADSALLMPQAFVQTRRRQAYYRYSEPTRRPIIKIHARTVRGLTIQAVDTSSTTISIESSITNNGRLQSSKPPTQEPK